MTSGCYLIFCGFAWTLLLTVGPHVSAFKQDIPESCNVNECEHFFRKRWEELTEQCCGKHPGTTYHCQQDGDHVIVACLEPVTCDPGSVPKLTETFKTEGAERDVTVTCKTCDEGYFQSVAKLSTEFKLPHCEGEKQRCSNNPRKALVTFGDTSKDSLCRCRWEDGWVLSEDSRKRPQCTDPVGFVEKDNCYCETCPKGTLATKDNKCVSSPAPKRKPEFVPSDKPFPGGLPESTRRNKKADEIYRWISSIVAALLILIPLVCIVYGFIQLGRVNPHED